jgi:hypothetical protein
MICVIFSTETFNKHSSLELLPYRNMVACRLFPLLLSGRVYIKKIIKELDKLIKAFNLIFRYIDKVYSINNLAGFQ